MQKNITITLPRKVIVEILKHLPLSEIKKIEEILCKNKDKKVPTFRISSSPFFGHKPGKLGKTSAQEIDKIINKQV